MRTLQAEICQTIVSLDTVLDASDKLIAQKIAANVEDFQRGSVLDQISKHVRRMPRNFIVPQDQNLQPTGYRWRRLFCLKRLAVRDRLLPLECTVTGGKLALDDLEATLGIVRIDRSFTIKTFRAERTLAWENGNGLIAR